MRVGVFFFFQAEDGIRDGRVTGVQTCALPPASSSTPRPASPTGTSSGWGRRSATPRRSSTPAGRSASASSRRSSTSSTGTARSGPERRGLVARIGVLGGAFNPPHVGHLVLAQEAAAQLGLDEVLLVPAGEAPHKRIEPEPGKLVRLEMTRLAAADNELLSASDLEVAREGPSYTFRTLELLAEQRPDDEPWFLMGADVAASIESWREPERVLELAGL